MDPVPASPSDGEPLTLSRRIALYLWRATWLKCPVCGTRPIFPPLGRIRGLSDWFTPLDGCPHCGYAYDREPGYFLWAVWALGYIVSAVVGTAIYVYLQIWHADWSIPTTLVWVMLPLPFINIVFARHAKAYFLAVDHLADPFIRPDANEGGDDGGGPRLRPPVAPTDAPTADESVVSPLPERQGAESARAETTK